MKADFAVLLGVLLLTACVGTESGNNTQNFSSAVDLGRINAALTKPLAELAFAECKNKVYFFYDPQCQECERQQEILESLVANLTEFELKKFCSPMYYHEGSRGMCGTVSPEVDKYGVDGRANAAPYVVFNCKYGRNGTLQDTESEREELKHILCSLLNSSTGFCERYPADFGRIEPELLTAGENETQFIFIEFTENLNYQNFQHFNIDLKANELTYLGLAAEKMALFSGQKKGIEGASGLEYVTKVYKSNGLLAGLVQADTVSLFYLKSGKDQQDYSEVVENASAILGNMLSNTSVYTIDGWSEGDKKFLSLLFEDTPAVVVSGTNVARVEPSLKDIVQAGCARVHDPENPPQLCSGYVDGNKTRVDMLMFYSPSCPHCQNELPIVADLEEEFGQLLNVTKINVLSPSYAEDLLISKYNVYAIPRIVINGYRSAVGEKDRETLRRMICFELNKTLSGAC